MLRKLLDQPLFDVFTAKPASPNADCYGRFSIPGSAVLDLPAGLVRLYYDEPAGFSPDLDPPRDLDVTVIEVATGDPVPIRYKSRTGSANAADLDVARAYVGRFEVDRPGGYRIIATSGASSRPDPHLSLGE